MPPSFPTSLALATLRRRNWHQASASALRRTATRTPSVANRPFVKPVYCAASRMVHTGNSATDAIASSASSNATQQPQKNGYATMADILSTYTSLDPPPSPYAPSLAHLNPETLPPGYEKPSPNATYSVFLPQLEKSSNDDRDYRLIRLDNGLECMLVSDPKTDKSAAGISVRVGHLSDPENAQGMAHFCEHLLFMGTEKYPAENEYSEYLAHNNGASNAYTGMDETVYYFDVHPPALPGALDRFAQFFIAPKFDDSCTEREILAVDSENKKNLQSDMWRLFQLEKSTSSRDHWYWRFGTGNKQTLWDDPIAEGRNTRSELIEWYGQHYSSNVMKLVVVAKDSLDDLTKLVAETFAPIKNRKLPPNVFSGTPFGPQQVKQHLYAQAVKNVRSMELAFPCADQSPLFATKPGHFITHYLGHEGEGSILSHLKKLGWADALGAGAGQGATGFDFFKISIELTKEGLQNHKKVAAIVFAYIDMLRHTEPQEWAFREQSMLNEIGFKFLEKRKPMSYVTQLCTQMQNPYPRSWVLSAPYLLRDWNPSLVQEQLQSLTPEKCRITVVSQDPVDELEWNQQEKWYGTKYRTEPFDEAFLKSASSDAAHEGLFLPKPNSFIPSNLDLLNDKTKVGEPTRKPNCIRQTEISRTWHKLDDRWWVPRATVSFYIKSPLIHANASNSVSVRLFLDLVMDAMSEYSYNADLAGLSYKLDTQADGILMTIDGYNDKLPVLAKVVLEKVASLKVDPKRFDLVKDQISRQYHNFNLAAPSQLTAYYTSFLTQKDVFLPAEKLAALDALTPEKLQAFIPELLSRLHIEALAHGNMLDSDAVEITQLAESVFKPRVLTKEEKLSPRSLLVPRGSNLIVRMPVPNPENVNSAIEYFCYVGDDGNDKVRTLNTLFRQLIDEPCFDTLRTKEQLGYLVHSSTRASPGMTGFRISIQSEREASYLEERIEAFFDKFEKMLEDMPEEQFEKEKTSLTNRLREDYKNLHSEHMYYWINIHSGYYDFGRKDRDAKLIDGTTKAEVLAFYREHIKPSASNRAKMSVHMQSQHVSKKTIEEVPRIMSEAGVPEISSDFKTLLESTPTPLISALEKAAASELEKQGKTDQTSKVMDALRESHMPSNLGDGKEILTDLHEVRKRMSISPPSFPVEEYQSLIAKL